MYNTDKVSFQSTLIPTYSKTFQVHFTCICVAKYNPQLELHPSAGLPCTSKSQIQQRCFFAKTEAFTYSMFFFPCKTNRP